MKVTSEIEKGKKAYFAYQSLAALIHKERGINLENFRASFLQRRLTKRFRITGCKGISDYLCFIESQPDEIDYLIRELAINVSWFYRNPLSWELLRKFIIPDLIQKKIKENDSLIRIWSAGCSKGEEPYTMAILLQEAIEKEPRSVSFQIFGTDVSENAIIYAKKGVYDRDIIKSLPYDFIVKYFTRNGETFAIKPELKQKVVFAEFDLLDKHRYAPSEAVFADFDLIICQNVLIYYQPNIQKRIFTNLARSLKTGNYLILGDVEEPPGPSAASFVKIFDVAPIFIKH